jgi:hypothetical protein
MKENKDILDEFGQKAIKNIFDPAVNNLLSLKLKENPPLLFKDYCELFQRMDDLDFKILERYIMESIGNSIYNFLKIFEENDNFKLIYENDGQHIDLTKISEMLKAEPIIQNGWIDRFSKIKNNL